jgi:hypothetical protein
LNHGIGVLVVLTTHGVAASVSSSTSAGRCSLPRILYKHLPLASLPPLFYFRKNYSLKQEVCPIQPRNLTTSHIKNMTRFGTFLPLCYQIGREGVEQVAPFHPGFVLSAVIGVPNVHVGHNGGAGLPLEVAAGGVEVVVGIELVLSRGFGGSGSDNDNVA